VFFRCVATTCLAVEGTNRETFDKIDKALGWDLAPVAPAVAPSQTLTQQTRGAEARDPESKS